MWLAWFLHTVLTTWAPIAAARGEAARAEAWTAHAAALKVAVERDGWDGNWYRRAYFDDGTPLGTEGSDACAIDSIAQSWSVMSGAAEPDRARRAMASVDQRLVRPDDDMILLLTPPFDHTALEPGYIKGYVPGVRENGAQYTHAAVWTVIAFAMLGDGDKAAELLAMLNPITHSSTPHGDRAVPRRALCGGGRRLLRGTARRPRRLDLVHRVGRLDVSRRDRMAARRSACRELGW